MKKARDQPGPFFVDRSLAPLAQHAANDAADEAPGAGGVWTRGGVLPVTGAAFTVTITSSVVVSWLSLTATRIV